MPEGARFCHKCGKPQLEEDAARLNAAESAPAAPVQAPLDVPSAKSSATAAPVGFGNLRAVTVTIAVAAVSLIPFALAMIAPPLGLVVLCAAGYCAAHFYRKQSMQPLSAGAGAYLGVMTGLWLFLVFALCGAIASIQVASPENVEKMKALLSRMPEMVKLLDDPHQFIVNLAQSLVLLFFLSTLSAAFGGMLAARVFARRSQP